MGRMQNVYLKGHHQDFSSQSVRWTDAVSFLFFFPLLDAFFGRKEVKVSHLWITLCESVVLQTEAHEAFVLSAICTSIKLDKPPLIPFGREETGSRCSMTSSTGDHSMKAGRVTCKGKETLRIKPVSRHFHPSGAKHWIPTRSADVKIKYSFPCW